MSKLDNSNPSTFSRGGIKFGNENCTIGLIGFGFVGKAIQHGFSQTCDFRIYDINPLESINTFEQVMTESDFIFVGVPTPSNFETGEQDNSIMDATVERCAPYLENTNKVLILKSTIVPGTTQAYIDKYPNVRIIFNPEFLTEKNFRLDFINQARIVLGGKKENTELVEKLYKQRFPTTPVFHTNATAAETVKYVCNCFFSVKLSFFNEIYQICEKLGIDYKEVLGMVMADGRIGNSHWAVPGPDGNFGYGGKCLAKDINALIARAKELGVDPTVMQAAWKKNLEVREDHDWTRIAGTMSNKKKK